MFSFSFFKSAGALAIALSIGATPVLAQGVATAAVSGSVLDQSSGLAVAGATVRAIGGGTEKTTTTTASGAFTFATLPPGLYQVVVSGSGYQAQRATDVALISGSTSYVNFVLHRARTAQDLSTIATVSVHASGNALTATTTISKSLDPSLLKAEGYTRFVDAVRTLPGVNFSGNLTAAAGDDASIDIRGLGATESVALLDGHPTGPQGVYPINGGGAFATSFNYSDSPFALLKNVQVTYGSGAAGLYGVDAIGGTIDMQTLSPTRDYHSSFTQGVGNEGILNTALTSTGSLGKLGYAFGGTVSGLYGMRSPGTQIAQTAYPVGVPTFSTCPAQPNYDLTSCTLAYNTYQVTGNTTLRGGLAKLVYSMSNNTSITGTWYGAGQWADSTGNGDGDNLPYDTRLAGVIASGSANCALPTDPAGTTSGYLVSTNTNPAACDTAQQFAASTSGPNGGGPGRNRGTGLFDYHLRFATTDRKSTYVADYFFDHYKFYKDSTQSLGLAIDPVTGLYPGQLFSQWDNTQGILLSDDIVNEKSEFAFGYLSEHQLQTRQNMVDGVYSWVPPQTYGYASVFARGNVELSPRFSVFANLWGTRSTVTQQSNLDPRVSLVYRPIGGHDVVRFTYGHATGDPAAELRASGPPQVTGNPASLNAVCSAYNVVGQGGNPNVKAEGATDFELGFAHRFEQDSNVQLNLYSTSVANQLYSASVPVTSFAGVTISPILLAGYAAKLAACPGVNPGTPSTALPFLAFQVPANLGQGSFQGIELTGRQRLTKNLALDYTYDIQKAALTGVPLDVLHSAWAIVPGGQIPLIPMHKGQLGLDYTSSGWEARLDGFYMGNNNPQLRPAYTYFNGFVSKELRKGYSLNLAVQNIFNQNTENGYGYFGHQQFVPENQFGTDKTSVQQYVTGNLGVTPELFGLPSTTVQLTLSVQI